MGIKGLRSFLRKYSPSIFIKVPSWKSFAGERIAIDASVYLYKYMSTSNKSCGNWIDMFINLIVKLRKNNVRPVFIFDGKPPPEKENTQKTRRSGRGKTEQKMLEIEECIEILSSCDSIPIDLLERIKNITNIDMEGFSKRELLKDLNIRYNKESSRFITIGQNEYKKLQDLLNAMGLPWYIAAGEAERTCAWLCKFGYVKAVLSTDSDVLVYGAPLFITEITLEENKIIEMIRYNDVIESLDLTREQFTDFCIMCGTDYNNNIRNVGPVKAYRLLQEHQSLDGISKIIPDTDILMYERVRELFTLPNKDEPSLVIMGVNGTEFSIAYMQKINKGELIMFIFKNNSRYTIEELEFSRFVPRFIIK